MRRSDGKTDTVIRGRQPGTPVSILPHLYQKLRYLLCGAWQRDGSAPHRLQPKKPPRADIKQKRYAFSPLMRHSGAWGLLSLHTDVKPIQAVLIQKEFYKTAGGQSLFPSVL